ncbi:hypothetical protein H072_9851 [Dactylellina haptotyla CBS 200.50]|uniref:Uncharacterized protein n=1 Tax=Dactylellina haptotyla (strain CBS 200.50) TaxID=1284197 RepID=S8A1M2_DACHA|nr:hypothetical protein H072_9851 [Dactylellina haptotyla CBS 200.50]
MNRAQARLHPQRDERYPQAPLPAADTPTPPTRADPPHNNSTIDPAAHTVPSAYLEYHGIRDELDTHLERVSQFFYDHKSPGVMIGQFDTILRYVQKSIRMRERAGCADSDPDILNLLYYFEADLYYSRAKAYYIMACKNHMCPDSQDCLLKAIESTTEAENGYKRLSTNDVVYGVCVKRRYRKIREILKDINKINKVQANFPPQFLQAQHTGTSAVTEEPEMVSVIAAQERPSYWSHKGALVSCGILLSISLYIGIPQNVLFG